MSTTNDAESSESSRERRQSTYERVVETVRQQTGGQQPAMIPESNLRQVCCSSGSLGVDEYRTARKAAVQNGTLINWHGRLLVAEPDAIVAALEEEAASEAPRSGFIARLNAALQDARGSK